MLGQYRVLDLTDEKGLVCGKLLGDLGADVIKIEKPGGDPARNIGPFYHDEPHPEKSLFWFAFNTSKRGVTLNLETEDGREIFKKLVKRADVVVESFPPGYLSDLDLDYKVLEKINPGIILVSITPFGQTGPYRDFKTIDITSWALSGQMYPYGDEDRPPVRMSHHSQAYLHAACEGAVGAAMALYCRELSGEGQHVDVSVQETLAQGPFATTASWDMIKAIISRNSSMLPNMNVVLKRVWHCKDGYVIWFFYSGLAGQMRNPPLVNWMKSEGVADDYMLNFDWSKFDYSTSPQEMLDRLEAPTGKFFLSHTKAELMEGAVKFGVQFYPVATNKDIIEDVQLRARGFWTELEHAELGRKITYPGAFGRSTELPPYPRQRAPLIGEHNLAIYEGELGISRRELIILMQANVI